MVWKLYSRLVSFCPIHVESNGHCEESHKNQLANYFQELCVFPADFSCAYDGRVDEVVYTCSARVDSHVTQRTL